MSNRISHGFTLIEVLIAMSLLSMMVVLLFGSLKICADSWYKGENKIAAVNEVEVVSRFFQQYLAVAKPLTNDFSKKTGDLPAPLAFQGKQQSLQFVSALPASAGRLGLQLFAINKQEDRINVTLTPFFSVTKGRQEDKETVVLLTGVSDFSIAYFGTDEVTDNKMSPATWHDQWLEKSTQPRLVKISIQRANGAFFPDLLIALKITNQQAQINTAVAAQ